MPAQIDSMESYKKWIDGYDTGIRYADEHVGKVIDKLKELGVYEDTLIIVSSDHGENQGELAVYGDHQTADEVTSRVPFIIRHPQGLGGKDRVDSALHYQFDCFATLVEAIGGKVPGSWDAESFLNELADEKEAGREHLVLSNCAWACQRSVRWGEHMMIKSYHTGFKNYPETMLFNVKEDPHQLDDLAEKEVGLVSNAQEKLDEWTKAGIAANPRGEDPMQTVLKEGGPFHANYKSQGYEAYLERLRSTGREKYAVELEARKREHQKKYG